MKRILFLIIVIGISLSGYAQVDFGKKFKAIPPADKSPKIKIAIPPKPDLPKITPPPVEKKNDLVKPKENRKEENPDGGLGYRRNQDLGSFKTTSATSKIRYRDAAFVDGDKIRVYLNDKVADYEVVMDGEFKVLEIKLEKGVNKIDFEALNEGLAPPNTAEFQVFDDKGVLISSNQWNLGTGFKGTILLTKE